MVGTSSTWRDKISTEQPSAVTWRRRLSYVVLRGGALPRESAAEEGAQKWV